MLAMTYDCIVLQVFLKDSQNTFLHIFTIFYCRWSGG